MNNEQIKEVALEISDVLVKRRATFGEGISILIALVGTQAETTSVEERATVARALRRAADKLSPFQQRHPIKAQCPYCAKVCDAAAAISGDGAPPRAGDISLCAYCQRPCVFTDELTLRPATAEDISLTAETNPAFYAWAKERLG